MLSLQPLGRALLNLILIGVLISLANAIDLKAICNTTSYPDSCLRSLTPIVESQGDNVGIPEVYRMSVEIAIDEVLRTSNGLLKLEEKFKNVSDSFSLRTLKICRDMLYPYAFTSLSDCLATPNDKPTAETVEDFKVWLTAAGIYHQTCIDGFDDAKDKVVRRAVLEQLENSIELTSNSLAILYTFEESLSAKSKSSNEKLRRLMASDQMSRWLSQREKELLERPLEDIRPDIVVAKDGSGNFSDIGDAIKAAPSGSSTRFVIYVKAGTYNETVKLDITKSNITIIGDGMDATIVSGNLSGGGGVPTADTPTFCVSGAGFMASDMGFENTAGAGMGQAVALMVDSDMAVFYRCKIAAFQDTLLVHANRQFFTACQIYGTIDFIFGGSAVVFENTTILARKPVPGQGNVITAQAKNDSRAYSGFSFINCTISPAENLRQVRTFLGRPWRNFATVVFLYTYMDSLIDPQGWLPMGELKPPETIYYGEYKNSGPGSPTEKRVRWKGVHSRMKRSQANMFSVDALIDGGKWLPPMGVSYNNNEVKNKLLHH